MDNNQLICISIEELEKEILNGKNFVLLEPIHDSKNNLLIGTSKILTLKDLEKIKARCPEILKKNVKVKHSIPHYVTAEKREQWMEYVASYVDKNLIFSTLSKDIKEFLLNYLRNTLRDSDYLVWKLSQLKNFSQKIFEHSVFTSFISVVSYRTFCICGLKGMVDGNEVEKLIEASLLHEIGLMKYDADFVSRKRLDVENSEESLSFLQYPIESYKTLHEEKEKHEISEDVMDAILNHNEYIDGTGNPRGIGGNDVSLLARFVGASHYFELLLRGEYTLKPRDYAIYIEKFRKMKPKFGADVVDVIDKSFKHMFSNKTKEYLSDHRQC